MMLRLLRSVAIAILAGAWIAPPRAAEPLDEALARLSDYLAAYQKQFQAVVAAEDYVQQIRVPRSPLAPRVLPLHPKNLDEIHPIEKVARDRHLGSDVLLVRLEEDGLASWASFRDVYEVDGRAVRGRDDRLARLFLDPARRPTLKTIADEGARFNIGRANRNVNVPMLAIQMLHPSEQHRFRFRLARQERIAGRDMQVLAFKERARPAIVRDSDGHDVPAEGLAWLDPERGAVLATELVFRTKRTRLRATISVTYAFVPVLRQLAPTRMEEVYENELHPAAGYTWCRATYSDFRRFVVLTTEQVK